MFRNETRLAPISGPVSIRYAAAATRAVPAKAIRVLILLKACQTRPGLPSSPLQMTSPIPLVIGDNFRRHPPKREASSGEQALAPARPVPCRAVGNMQPFPHGFERQGQQFLITLQHQWRRPPAAAVGPPYLPHAGDAHDDAERHEERDRTVIEPLGI